MVRNGRGCQDCGGAKKLIDNPDLLFKCRLGLALGKSHGEIEMLPAPEYKAWQLFYLLEPWGWHNQEYLVASILTMLHNVNRTKRSKAAKITKFIRNMGDALLRRFARPKGPDFDLSTQEGREAATAYVERKLRSTLG